MESYFKELSKPANQTAFMLSFWASMGTFLGGFLVVLIVGLLGADPAAKSTSKIMGVLQSLSGGVMIFMTCFHLIPESTESIGSRQTMIYFFIGVVAFAILEEIIIPGVETDEAHEGKEATKGKKNKNSGGIKNVSRKDQLELYRTSLITFIAMALHNIPEGISVYLASLSNPKMGYQLALAILLHNIPEGMAVGIPLYASTGSIFQVLWWTLINGLAEPAGVLMGGMVLAPYLDEYILSRCLAMVGGIMFCISIHELYPVSIKYCGKHMASASLMIGMFFCWVALESVDSYFEGIDMPGHSHSHGHSHGH